MTEHEHCWHRSGEYFATARPYWALYCCRCPVTTESQDDVPPSEGPHGDIEAHGVKVRDFPIQPARVRNNPDGSMTVTRPGESQ